MVFQWSTPVRRNDAGEALSPIPNEIYAKILWEAEPKRQDFNEFQRALSRMALVCRFFASLLLPQVFDTLVFDGSPDTHRPELNHSAFCRSTVHDNGLARTLAKYVRTCHFKNWRTDRTTRYATTAFLKLFLNAMPFMENLENLHFLNTYITIAILSTIPKMKRLKALHIDDIRGLDDPRGQSFLHGLTTLQLKHLAINPATDPHGVPESHLAPLATAFDYSSLTSLVIGGSSLLKNIEESPTPLPLVDLEIYLRNPVTLSNAAFHRLPNLRKLIIGPSQQVLPLESGLDTSSMPFLEEIHCDPELLASFVPGRPVSRVTIHNNGRINNHLLPLAQSSASSISVTVASWRFFALVEHYCIRKVETLRLLDYDEEWNAQAQVITSFRAAHRFIPHIKQVHFVPRRQHDPPLHGSLNLKKQYQALRQFSRSKDCNPVLIQLGRIIWTREVTGDWTVKFEESLRECLVRQAELSEAGYAQILLNDHGDYLKQLLSPYGVEAPPVIDIDSGDLE